MLIQTAVPTIPAFSSKTMKFIIIAVILLIIVALYLILQNKSSSSDFEEGDYEEANSLMERKEEGFTTTLISASNTTLPTTTTPTAGSASVRAGSASVQAPAAGSASVRAGSASVQAPVAGSASVRAGSASAQAPAPAPAPGSASSPAPIAASVSQPTGSLASSYNPPADRPATVAELNDFITRIQAEITRLNASGTTDELTQRRVSNLQAIIDRVKGILDQVSAKTLPENQIPIMKSQIDQTMRALQSNSPLPDIFAGNQIDTYLKGILPQNLENNPEVTNTINSYLKSFTKNLSWYFGLKYVSDAEKEVAEKYNRRAGQVPDNEPDFYVDNFAKANAGYEHQPDSFGQNTAVTDEFANTPHEARRGPAHFDWKRRSEQICKAIRGRGDNPQDFGCMPENMEVSEEFSYRGYAQMICTRANANADSGYSQLIGCPPLDWTGWRDQGLF